MSYKKNFISGVIFRTDYPIVFEIQDEEPKEFSEKIKRIFPNYGVEKGVQIDFSVNENLEVDQNTETEDTYIFSNKEGDIKVILSRRAIILHVFKYKKYSEMKEVIKLIINSFREVYGLEIINRVGLRYINDIDTNENDNPLLLGDYFAESLFCGVDFIPDKKNKISRFVSQLHFNEGDHKINFQYGNPNKNYPNSISKKIFMIDIDAFSADVPVGESDLLNFIDKLHDSIKDIFEKSIKQKTRCLLNEEKTE